ncbi:hypothetical protein A2716_02965 [candidate division WWE3 bacterium RIFCSPHIGHO2_01_FULL_40_23]|uniref:ComEC/Rec2-related protein domain-containing protein n=1 Tax=candidate division WWE3 bacterium RIFCSPLOWO2_01_FULL_41_18 TaxID=1802625 RepID=A0A1F4VBZ8_UNCKA|nr:MAG: hypothetical protein A2716_02965 [candidate division WWE3 bacterium RIFCSPHIGHO2_01_FULL_40_23]OGC54772.1 MAG: hypothetical protein A3A78_05160 [candidate division WWE3 bacterium RIFCSPLOWO2_01_FULL_41_18]
MTNVIRHQKVLILLALLVILFLTIVKPKCLVCLSANNRFRTRLVELTETLLPKPHSSLLSGIIFGIKESLPKSFEENLKRTGTIHVVVASGYNISVVSFLFTTFVSGLLVHYSRFKKFLIVQFLVLFYVALSGFQAPILRAYIMSIFVSFGELYGRKKSTIWILIVTALLMIFYKPSWALNLSFQFSFLSTLGLILYANRIEKGFLHLLNKLDAPFMDPTRLILKDFFQTMSATLFVWPLISFYFGRVSLLSPFVNVLVLWTVPAIMVLGGVIVAAAVFFPVISKILIWPVYLLLEYFVSVVNYFGSLRFSDVGFRVNLIFIGFYYALLLFSLTFFKEN